MKNYNGLSPIKAFGAMMFLTILMVNFRNAEGQLQPDVRKNMFKSLPANLPLPAQPQRYHITTDYFNRTLQGTFIDKIRVAGDFTTNLPEKKEKWNNVTVAKSQQFEGVFGAGEPQSYKHFFQ